MSTTAAVPAAESSPTPAPAPTASPEAGPSTLALVAAFGSIYVIWGSTYLAIRVVVQTMPPLMAASARFLVAGALLFAWLVARGVAPPTPRQWGGATLIGGLLLLGGNGGVMIAETMIESGVTALLVALVPLWMVAMNALRPGGVAPGLAEIGGLLLGFAGVWMLVAPSGGVAVDWRGAAAVIGATMLWALGSVMTRHITLPSSRLMSTAGQMLAGGALLLVAGLARGEWRGLNPAGWSTGSVFALAYLIVFGSLVAFSAYVWLLNVTTPARVGTYALVNPAVAVVLGAVVLGERLDWKVLGAMALIITAVVVITRYSRK